MLFPPQCLLCGSTVEQREYGSLCSSCIAEMPICAGPVCSQCGAPFVSEEGSDHLCGSCIVRPPRYDQARAVGTYSGYLREAIQLFKYGKKTLFARPLGTLLADHGKRLLPGTRYDSIVPVPLHRRRLRRRCFNQSLMLARRVGALWGVRVSISGFKRIHWTDPQVGLALAERRRNIKGAFACSAGLFSGARVLLVDDVYTSGATVNECAAVLKRAGAVTVDVLTLARAQRENER